MSALIERAIDSLQELGEYLCDEIVEERVDNQLTPRGKACKEAQLSIQVLTVKLEAIRQQGASVSDRRQLQLSGCEICD